jgi:signal transduction histidine kinase
MADQPEQRSPRNPPGPPGSSTRLREELARMTSEAARLHEQLDRSVRLLEEARQAESDARSAHRVFQERVVHELRTPLTSLTIYAGILGREADQRGALDEERIQQMGRSIVQRALDLARLIGQLTEVTYAEQVTVGLAKREFELHALLVDGVAPFEAQGPQHTFSIVCPEGLWMWADPLRLDQVLLNLLDNAVKFSPDGGPVLVEVSLPTAETLRLTVTDCGIGISTDDYPHVFERFFRGHPSGRFSGMGLGLFFSRHIVELHGGTLEAEPVTTGGTRLVMELPMHAAGSPSRS